MYARLLVTGGAGLIGSALCERALRAGGRVVVLDNLSSGRRENLPADPRVELVVGDACDDAAVAPLVRACDAVAHLAAGVGVPLVLARPTGTLRQSLLGAETVLRHAAAARRPVFFASSSEVYGDAGPAPLREDRALGFGSPETIRHAYAAGKAAGEALAFAYAREYALPIAVGRFFNVTGARQPAAQGVLPAMVDQALRGGPIVVHGDGAQTRAFLDAADAAEYVWRLLARASPAGVLANVGRDAPLPILDLARLVRARVEPRASIEHRAPAYGAGFAPIRHRRPDVARLLALTGHEPAVALAATIDACASSLAAAR